MIRVGTDTADLRAHRADATGRRCPALAHLARRVLTPRIRRDHGAGAGRAPRLTTADRPGLAPFARQGTEIAVRDADDLLAGLLRWRSAGCVRWQYGPAPTTTDLGSWPASETSPSAPCAWPGKPTSLQLSAKPAATSPAPFNSSESTPEQRQGLCRDRGAHPVRERRLPPYRERRLFPGMAGMPELRPREL